MTATAERPETALAESTGVRNPLVLLQSMIERGADPDALGKMMDLAERWEANQAATVYAEALTAFQAECPAILKSRSADRYKFAGYDDIMRVAAPILARHKISVSFQTPATNERFEMTMRIRVGSHFEDKAYSAPLGDMDKIAASIKVTQPQAWGLCLSYHKRYCLCNGLNIVVSDTDSDNDMQPQFDGLSDAQKQWIVASFAAYKALPNKPKAGALDWSRFLDWLHADTLDTVSAATWAPIKELVDRKVRDAGGVPLAWEGRP